MWTPTTRRHHSRAGLRYGSDLTNGEWALLRHFLPPEAKCGRKRHALVDTEGRALKLRASRSRLPFVKLAFADAGYQGPRVAAASPIRVQIVRKLGGQTGFALQAKRWVAERFFAWINRNRRLAKDVEPTKASAEAFLYAASAILLPRRLAR